MGDMVKHPVEALLFSFILSSRGDFLAVDGRSDAAATY
jgi:hypothetical protein